VFIPCGPASCCQGRPGLVACGARSSRGCGGSRGYTLHEVETVKDTLVAVAPEAASLLATALFGAAKVTGDVDALVLEDPFRFGQRYG
jgi:hypothetical protein